MRKELAKIIAALDNTFCIAFQRGESWLQERSLKKAEEVAGRKRYCMVNILSLSN